MLFHKQVYQFLRSTGLPQTTTRGFFFTKGLYLSKSKDIFSQPELDYKTSPGDVPNTSPTGSLQSLSVLEIPGPFKTQTPILIVFSIFRTFRVIAAHSYKLLFGGSIPCTTPPPRLRPRIQK